MNYKEQVPGVSKFGASDGSMNYKDQVPGVSKTGASSGFQNPPPGTILLTPGTSSVAVLVLQCRDASLAPSVAA